MEVIYSRSTLEDKKYGELLQIIKKLGLKGRRLKTEKLINLILDKQSMASLQNASPSLSILDNNLSLAAQDVADAFQVATQESVNCSDISVSNHEKDYTEQDHDNNTLIFQSTESNHNSSCEFSILDVNDTLSLDELINPISDKTVELASNLIPKRRTLRACAAASDHPKLKRSNTFSKDPQSSLVSAAVDASEGTDEQHAGMNPNLKTLKRQPFVLQDVDVDTKPAKKIRKTPSTDAGLLLSTRVSRQSIRTGLVKSPVAEQLTAGRPFVHPQDQVSLVGVAEGSEIINVHLRHRRSIGSHDNRRSNTPVSAGSPLLKKKREASSQQTECPEDKVNNVEFEDASEEIKQVTPSTRRSSAAKSTLSTPENATKMSKFVVAGNSFASPRLSQISSQSKRLSSVKRLSTSRPKRVIPTVAKPVVLLDKLAKNENDKEVPGGEVKSCIPRFMAYAQKVTKMPNFQRIHQKAFNSMQTLDDFMAKKKDLGASVHKVPIVTSSFTPSVISTKDLQLNFSGKLLTGPGSPVVKFGTSTSKSSSATNFASPTAASVARAALNRKTPFKTGSRDPVERVSTAGRSSARKPSLSAAFVSSLKENMKPSSPRFSATTKATGTKSNIDVSSKRSTCNTGIKAVTSDTCNTGIEAVTSGNKQASIITARSLILGAGITTAASTVTRPAGSVADHSTCVTASRLPLVKMGGGSRAAPKSLVNRKTNINKQERRAALQEFVKGVRTNKRFQLQMEKRGMKLQ